MAKKTSFKYKLLNILTFGHLSRKAKKIAKEQEQNKNTELKVNSMGLPDIDRLTSALGGSDNVGDVSSTISTIKFTLKDISKINMDELKAIAIKGVIKGANSVTMVIGDCAAELAKVYKVK